MGEVIAFPEHLVKVASALAYEGVPIGVISRALRLPSEDVREQLREAIDRGELIELPAADWPPTARRADRMPVPTAHDIERLILHARTVFKVTAQQAVVFVTLLVRHEVKKEQLLAAVQHQRLTKSALPNDMEEPQIKLIDVVVHNLRKRLAKHGIVIETLWGSGYSIAKSHRELAFKLIQDYLAGEQPGTPNADKNDAGPKANRAA